jgi:hypothetical protein
MLEPIETSLSKLSEHDWSILSNRWARGIDWNIEKLGKKWHILGDTGGFPLFKTKSAAYDALTNLILAESHHRAWLRNLEGGSR